MNIQKIVEKGNFPEHCLAGTGTWPGGDRAPPGGRAPHVYRGLMFTYMHKNSQMVNEF